MWSKRAVDRYTITSGGSAIVDAHTQQPLFQRTMQPTALLLPLLYTAWRTGIARMDVFNTAFTGSFGQGLEDKVLRVRVRNAVMPQDEWEDFRAYRKFLDLFYAMEDKSELVYLTTGNERGDMPDKLREIIDALDAFDLTVSAAGCIDDAAARVRQNPPRSFACAACWASRAKRCWPLAIRKTTFPCSGGRGSAWRWASRMKRSSGRPTA